MNLKKIKFHKEGNDFLTESKISIATSFRHYLNLPSEGAFSGIGPNSQEYTPLMYAFRNDIKGREVYEEDVVFIQLPDIYSFIPKEYVWKLCVVGFDEDRAAFGVYDLEPEFESLEFTPFSELKEDVKMLRLGSRLFDMEKINKFLGLIDRSEMKIETFIEFFD